MREINEIIVHCTATPPGFMAGATPAQRLDEVRRWHVEDNGWSDIGYNYLIDRGGQLLNGRPISKAGAHVKGHNSDTVGISLFGGKGGTKDQAFEDNFTPEQGETLRKLIGRLQNEYGPDLKISGHQEYANKACPCFDVRRWLNNRPVRTSATQSTTLQASAAAAVSGATGAATAVSALDGTAQIVVIIAACVAALALLWIMRERIKKWGQGDR